MTLILTVLNAIGALLPALEALIKSAFSVWSDETSAAGTDPTALANDAIGAAQAAVKLQAQTEAQIAAVRQELDSLHPALSTEHKTAVAAMAVSHVKSQATP